MVSKVVKKATPIKGVCPRSRPRTIPEEPNRNSASDDERDEDDGSDGADELDRDEPILGQKYACVSFASPSDVVGSKDAFFFRAYIREVFLHKVQSFADGVAASPMNAKQFLGSFEKELDDVFNDFACFCASRSNDLEKAFEEENPDSLTVAGFKIRGSYPTLKKARARAAALQMSSPSHSVFVSEVGAWCPFNPSAESIGDVVYDVDALNNLMRAKKEQEDARNQVFTENTRERIQKARLEGEKGREPDKQTAPPAANDDDGAGPSSSSL